MKRAAVAAACLALALLTFFQFPGHTWLQQDSQIYAAILERQENPAAFRNEILTARPHVAFTLYDEAARALRAATGLSFERVLELEQIVARAFGIWGLYLCALCLLRGAGVQPAMPASPQAFLPALSRRQAARARSNFPRRA